VCWKLEQWIHLCRHNGFDSWGTSHPLEICWVLGCWLYPVGHASKLWPMPNSSDETPFIACFLRSDCVQRHLLPMCKVSASVLHFLRSACKIRHLLAVCKVSASSTKHTLEVQKLIHSKSGQSIHTKFASRVLSDLHHQQEDLVLMLGNIHET